MILTRGSVKLSFLPLESIKNAPAFSMDTRAGRNAAAGSFTLPCIFRWFWMMLWNASILVSSPASAVCASSSRVSEGFDAMTLRKYDTIKESGPQRKFVMNTP